MLVMSEQEWKCSYCGSVFSSKEPENKQCEDCNHDYLKKMCSNCRACDLWEPICPKCHGTGDTSYAICTWIDVFGICECGGPVVAAPSGRVDYVYTCLGCGNREHCGDMDEVRWIKIVLPDEHKQTINLRVKMHEIRRP